MNNAANANLQRAIEASRRMAEEENALALNMAQSASRGTAENDLYIDASIEMRENMFGKPDARLRLIAGTGIDTILMFTGRDPEIEAVRDQLLETRYSDEPVESDPIYQRSQEILAAFDVEDTLSARLMEVHAMMIAEEAEEAERKEKERRNIMNRIQREREAQEAAAAAAARPVVPNRAAMAARRAAFFSASAAPKNAAPKNATKGGGRTRRRRSHPRRTRRYNHRR